MYIKISIACKGGDVRCSSKVEEVVKHITGCMVVTHSKRGQTSWSR